MNILVFFTQVLLFTNDYYIDKGNHKNPWYLDIKADAKNLLSFLMTNIYLLNRRMRKS